MIQWMKDQGHSPADIAAKTGLGVEEYVKDILNLLRRGEERLLEAVLHGKIPITIAVGISGASDEESQRLLMEAYERKEMTQKTLRRSSASSTNAARLGKGYGPRRQRSARGTRLPKASCGRTGMETQRQKTHGPQIQALRGAPLVRVSAAFRVLDGRRGLHQPAAGRGVAYHAEVSGRTGEAGSMSAHRQGGVRPAGVTLPLSAIHPIRQVKPTRIMPLGNTGRCWRRSGRWA